MPLATVAAQFGSSSIDAPRSSGSAGRFIAVQAELAPKDASRAGRHVALRLEGSDVRVESMHPGWVETPGVARYLPTFRKITRPLLRGVDDGADTAVWLVATRPDSKPGHFWHDSAQRPTTFGWQRAEDQPRWRTS
jgi:hypothetical protein